MAYWNVIIFGLFIVMLMSVIQFYRHLVVKGKCNYTLCLCIHNKYMYDNHCK